MKVRECETTDFDHPGPYVEMQRMKFTESRERALRMRFFRMLVSWDEFTIFKFELEVCPTESTERDWVHLRW